MVRSSKRIFVLLVVTFCLVVAHSAVADTRIPETAALAALRAAIFAPAAADQAPEGGAWMTACTVTLRCPNGTILTCPGTPCHRLNNCEIFCQGVVEDCTGTCTIQ